MRTLAWLFLQRGLLAFLTLLAVSAVIFVGTELLPGDVAQVILGQTATPEAVAALRRELGLDQAAPVRYLDWISGALHGDLGKSLANRLPISVLVGEHLGKTLVLAGAAAVVAIPLSLGLGIVAALYRDTVVDRGFSAVTLAIVSFPAFLIGYVRVIVFAVQLR